MRVTKEQAAKNRQQILQAAKRLCRERGFAASGVAEVMAAAGFTHGGFYGHFASKDDLMAQACRSIFDEKVALWDGELEGPRALPQLAKRYLTIQHCLDPGTACPMATIAADAARSGGPVREAYTDGVKRLFEKLTEKLAHDQDPEARKKALRAWASVTGAVSIARSVDDPVLAQELLDAVMESFSEPT